MRKLRGSLIAIASGLAIVMGFSGVAVADSVSTVAYYDDYLDHLGNQANGRVHFEAWINQYKNANGTVIGTVGRTRMTDITGGVVAVQVNRQALKWRDSAGTSIQRNDTAAHQDTPGTQVSLTSDTNDSVGDFYWANTEGHSLGSILGYDSNVSVRWGDGSLGTYALGSLDSFYYTCIGGGTGACGSSSRSIPV